MARTATTLLAIGTWADSDNPGAGSQTVSAGNVGLNQNFLVLDKAVGFGHTVEGAHKDDIIDGVSLKSTVVDGTTLEKSGNSFRIKDAGITAIKLATDSVTSIKIPADAITTVKILDANITAGKLATDAVIAIKILADAVTTVKILNDAVTPAKISHDNNRTKAFFTFASATEASGGFFLHNGQTLNVNFGVKMPRAGSITSVLQSCTGGGSNVTTFAYGDKTFAAEQRLAMRYTTGAAARNLIIVKDATDFITSGIGTGTDGVGAPPMIITIEVEFDD